MVGKWLTRAPRILILDEPTVGVDVVAKAEIYTILRRERDRGAAVLVVSSDLEEVMTLATGSESWFGTPCCRSRRGCGPDG